MMAEARRIVDAGNDHVLVLCLTGGLAPRRHALDLEFAEREYFKRLPRVEPHAHMHKRAHFARRSCAPALDHVDFAPHLGFQDLEHVADSRTRDWGLYVEVMTNIDTGLEQLTDYELSPREVARVGRTFELAQDMLTEHTRSLRWHLRARVAKRLRWSK